MSEASEESGRKSGEGRGEARAEGRDFIRAIIAEDLRTLEAHDGNDPVEWAYVQVFGRMTLGDEPAGRRAIRAWAPSCST